MTRTRRTTRPARRRRAAWLFATAAVVVVAVAATVGVGAATGWFGALGPTPPGPGTRFVVAAESAAAQAAAQASGTDTTADAGEAKDAADFLAAQPTAYWLTPERDPIGAVAARVTALAGEARTQDATLALVVYGLPERDCGNHSAGGLSPTDYPTWIDEIAGALVQASEVRAVVILEPDSLSLATECGNLDDRVAQLRAAVAALQRENTWIYLDGGHSNWHPAAEQARLLTAVGLGGVRGFSLNVSNFNATDAEVSYAHAVARNLDAPAHAFIDTSRNGAGSNGEWCNPPGRLVGQASGTIGDDVVDTNLWIKPPGESDGPCNGGPAAGEWWPAAAIELTHQARR
ncbi:glycoside hydrolase family 6 protein [Microbacterium sp. bgisy203]|uniref:glycoside hydrolase family 6 protein n=1 Tax=Microbacterium sp. bgisy203 TaxID=3413799 RepID=UPI003D745734